MLSIPLAINLGKPYHAEAEVQVQGTRHQVILVQKFPLYLEPCTGIFLALLPYALRLTPAGSYIAVSRTYAAPTMITLITLSVCPKVINRTPSLG